MHPNYTWANTKLYLSQYKYVLDIISETGLSRSKPASTHIKQNHHLATDNSSFFPNPDRYQ